MKTLAKPEFDTLVDDWIADDPREVVGPVHDGSKFVFDRLDTAEQLRLDYDLTMLSPKKYFFPQRERLVQYQTDGDGYDMVRDWSDESRIIVGVHPYDLEAIKQLDAIFMQAQGDEPYRKKRENSVLVGSTMQSVSDYSFAASMGTTRADSGYDLFVTELDDVYAIEIGSKKGNVLLEDAPTREATFEEVEAVEARKTAVETKFDKEIEFAPEQLPSLLKAGYDSFEVWDEYADGCLSCGTCNVVCPTCYCFNVDIIEYLTDEGGETCRRWDGCLLEEFAAVAGGENFREERVERHRHRLMRKGNYLYERFGDIACVGCGRCTQQCVADVADPSEIYNELWRSVNA